jgi:hypothetical protein
MVAHAPLAVGCMKKKVARGGKTPSNASMQRVCCLPPMTTSFGVDSIRGGAAASIASTILIGCH